MCAMVSGTYIGADHDMVVQPNKGKNQHSNLPSAEGFSPKHLSCSLKIEESLYVLLCIGGKKMQW